MKRNNNNQYNLNKLYIIQKPLKMYQNKALIQLNNIANLNPK